MHNTIVVEFKKWRKRFEASERGRDALARLVKKFPATMGGAHASLFGQSLHSAILRACFSAATFTPGADPDHARRRDNRAALTALTSQGKAVKTLRRYIRDYPLAAMFATAYAYVDLRKEGIEITALSGQHKDIRARFDRVLAALEANLTERGTGFACGVYQDRNAYGCLVYDSPLDSARRKTGATARTNASTARATGRMPGPKLMLLFDLVQTFRMASTGDHSRSYGQRMPSNAKDSQYGLAAALVSATFPGTPRLQGKNARKQLQKFLKKGQEHVGYCEWPIIRDWNEFLRELDLQRGSQSSQS